MGVMVLALLIAFVLQGVLWTRERRGRALSQHTSDLVALCEAGGRIRAVSPSCQTVLGYAPAELKGRSTLDLVHADDRCRVRELFQAHGSQPEMAGRLKVRLQRTDGSWRTVEHMAEDATERAIVASTVALGHSLGLQVVAEGVEDRQTQQMLAGISCDAAQGYHPSRPLPADDVAPWLREARSAAA